MRCIWRSFSILYVFLYKCLCVILGLVFWQVLWYYKNKYIFLHMSFSILGEMLERGWFMMPLSKETECAEIYGIDILEESLQDLDAELMNILLLDRTTRKNILWATYDYISLGIGFEVFSEITPDHITGRYATLIQPRTAKSKDAQADRTRDKAEVFTPLWICNKQNNLIDTQWFGRTDVFNVENGTSWVASSETISFHGAKKGWKKYVDAQRLEVSCGEAPYLVSRYDTVTGEKIPLHQRIGLLDRKMRIVQENAETPEDWLTWAQRAFESVYGFEYQGDNLLLARENLLYSYIEYYQAKFHQMPGIPLLRKIAHIISWNIWQMDGLKYVVPGSCKPDENHQMILSDFMDLGGDAALANTTSTCPGCATGNIYRHTGNYCRIMDWRSKRSQTFISMMKGGHNNGRL